MRDQNYIGISIREYRDGKIFQRSLSIHPDQRTFRKVAQSNEPAVEFEKGCRSRLASSEAARTN